MKGCGVVGSWIQILIGIRRFNTRFVAISPQITPDDGVNIKARRHRHHRLCCLSCHKRGVWIQAYVKKRGNWPRGVPGAVIDLYFDDMELGHCETLVAEHDNVPFFIHCCHDLKYVSKIMSTHGMLEMVQDHPTWRKIDGQWKSFKYTEPFSRY